MGAEGAEEASGGGRGGQPRNSVEKPLAVLGDRPAPVSEGVKMQLVRESTQPQPLVLYFGSASSAQAVRETFHQHAHLIFAEKVNPSLIRNSSFHFGSGKASETPVVESIHSGESPPI